MFIKSLSIFESQPTERRIRTVPFKRGANFIVDGTNSTKGNGIGKTTVLRVIDVCLGAKDRKYIYIDEELGITNTKLRDYINESKVYAELILVSNIDSPDTGERYAFKVDLFERGHRYVNGEKYNEKDYWSELNKILFDNNSNTPSFRQLIGMFVRIKLKDDNNRFLKYLDNFSSNADYENIYSFLFRWSDQAIGESKLNLRKKVSSLTNNINQLTSINGIKSINALEQKIIELEKEAQAVRRKIGNIINADELKKNEQDISYVRENYSRIANEIDQLRFKLSRITGILDEAKVQTDKSIDLTVLKNLYEDTVHNFSDINKTFDDLLKFNEKLLTNKVAFFEKQKVEISKRLTTLETERQGLFRNYRDVVLLIKDSDVAGYVQLQSQLEDKINNIGRYQKIVELYNDLIEARNTAAQELENLEKLPKVDPKSLLSKFNDFFKPYSNAINHEAYLLYKTDKPDSFPLALENSAESGLSTGTKKSAIAAFDLAYQSYAEEEKITRPHFIVHDVIETIDSVGLSSTVKIARDVGCQYIVAVLREKIERNSEVQQSDIRLTLTKTDRFFKI